MTISEAGGKRPVEPTCDVGVASGPFSREDRTPPVGVTISEAGGKRPVEPTCDVGVASGRSEESRPPTRPADVLGRTISDDGGNLPVEATSSGL